MTLAPAHDPRPVQTDLLICSIHLVPSQHFVDPANKKFPWGHLVYGCPKCDNEKKRKNGECICGFVCPRMGYFHLPDCTYKPKISITTFGRKKWKTSI